MYIHKYIDIYIYISTKEGDRDDVEAKKKRNQENEGNKVKNVL